MYSLPSIIIDLAKSQYSRRMELKHRAILEWDAKTKTLSAIRAGAGGLPGNEAEIFEKYIKRAGYKPINRRAYVQPLGDRSGVQTRYSGVSWTLTEKPKRPEKPAPKVEQGALI